MMRRLMRNLCAQILVSTSKPWRQLLVPRDPGPYSTSDIRRCFRKTPTRYPDNVASILVNHDVAMSHGLLLYVDIAVLGYELTRTHFPRILQSLKFSHVGP